MSPAGSNAIPLTLLNTWCVAFYRASETDEGAALIEVAFDIASGATYKFNTGLLGPTVRR